MDLDQSVTVGGRTEGSRKVLKSKQKREREYENRYKDKDPLLLKFRAPCQHREGRFECLSIPKNILARSKRIVFFKQDKKEQDKRLAFLMDVKHPKRSRPRGERRFERHGIAVKYFLLSAQGEKRFICTKFFQKLFNIGQRRMNTIAKGIKSGKGVVETRGGDRKTVKFSEKALKVKEFISRLKACESHYARNKSKRLYLPSTLSINKLFKMYNDSVEENLRVKKTFFSKIFSTKFNLGFGSPACDTCSYCLRVKSEIKSCEDEKEKQRMIGCLSVHRARAKAFHALMKEKPPGSVTFVFDLQQVQPLPKLTIGECFYARQISFYCFCVTDVQNEHPQFYVWDETQAGRGAEEISSALTNFLQQLELDDTISTIRLFADGCGGQNKNQHVVHALTYWMLKESPLSIKDIVLYFPVRGHSFLPADRVFGRVEKKLRKVEDVLDPAGYHKIYKEVANIRVLGKDWHIKDYKALTTVLKKVDGISEMKRIYLRKVRTSKGIEIKIKLEPTYRFDDISKKFSSMTKRGYILNRDLTERSIQPLRNHIKPVKQDNVRSLLESRFGPNWEDIIPISTWLFYANVFHDNPEATVEEEPEELTECICLEEESELRHI